MGRVQAGWLLGQARFMVNVVRGKGFYVIKKFLEILAPNQSPVLTLLLFFLKESTEFVLGF